MRMSQIHRGIVLSLLSVAIPITMQAQKIVVGQYQTSETFDKAFVAALQAAPLAKFSVKASDKQQGTIQAVKSSGGKEYGSLFVMIRKEGSNIVVEGTFTRHSGFMGGGKPEDWAHKYGAQLKSGLPDVTINVTKK